MRICDDHREAAETRAAQIAGLTLDAFRARRELLALQARFMLWFLGGQDSRYFTVTIVAGTPSVAETDPRGLKNGGLS
jgi:hypothetical protein